MASSMLSVDSQPPVFLQIEDAQDSVEIKVIGQSESPYQAHFVLETRGNSGNRTRQSGVIKIMPNQVVTAVTVRLSVDRADADAKGWTTTLTVTPPNGERYNLTKSG